MGLFRRKPQSPLVAGPAILEFVRYVSNRYAIILYSLGFVTLLIAVGILVAFQNSPVGNILVILGTGIVITTLVTSILNYFFQQDIARAFSIISGAERSVIRTIHPEREAALTE